MSELLDRIHGEIRARLAASEAAVRESERLEAALAAIDGGGTRPQPSSPATPRSTRRRTVPEAAPKRAPRGANRAAALRAIAERPGITAGDLVGATQIKRPVLYALLSRLTDTGELVKDVVADGPARYTLAPTTPDPVAEADPSAPAPERDSDVEPELADDTAAHTPSASPDADPAAASPDAEAAEPIAASSGEQAARHPERSSPRSRRRAKVKAGHAAARTADTEGESPAGEQPANGEAATSALAEGAPAAPDQLAASVPEPKRRPAKPRPASRPRRAKANPKPAA